MYIVAGLGNPGLRFHMTRHNIGFHTIDYMADELGVKVNKSKFNALFGETEIEGEKTLLVKPQTFMNLSGDSIVDFVKFYKIPLKNLIIINDDISLETGRIRVRAKGSAGGHNGLKSIIYQLRSEDFTRIKIGVGHPDNENYDLADYVLGRFTKDEIPVLEKSIINASKAVSEIIKNGVASTMNLYNSR